MSGYPPLDEVEPDAQVAAARALESRLTSIESEAYRRNTRTAVTDALEFFEERFGIQELEDVEVLHCRRWAQELARRSREDEIGASTAHAYHACARATWSWWVDDEVVTMNPMRPNRVQDELPDDTRRDDAQFWGPDDRDQLLEYVDEAAHAALEDATQDAIQEFRDRLLVYLLADSGVRGAEILATGDDRRNGATFGDVDPDEPALYVLGKSGEWEWAGLSSPALRRVERFQRLLDAPDAWPLLPTLHRPSLHAALRDGLDEDVDVEELLQEASVLEAMRDHGIAPPALTVDGGRDVMKRLCAAAEIDVDEGYLKPHGARRALGDELYDVQAEKAQEALRHKDIATTHDRYRQKKAGKVSRSIDEVRYGSDSGENDE